MGIRFEFYPNHIRVTIIFELNKFEKESDVIIPNELNEIQSSIIKLVIDNPNITQSQLSVLLGVTVKTISRNFRFLIDNNYIKRVGANKNGYWIIVK